MTAKKRKPRVWTCKTGIFPSLPALHPSPRDLIFTLLGDGGVFSRLTSFEDSPMGLRLKIKGNSRRDERDSSTHGPAWRGQWSSTLRLSSLPLHHLHYTLNGVILVLFTPTS